MDAAIPVSAGRAFATFISARTPYVQCNNALPEKEMGEKEVNEMEFAISKSVQGRGELYGGLWVP